MYPLQMALPASFRANVGNGFRAENILLNCEPEWRRHVPPALRAHALPHRAALTVRRAVHRAVRQGCCQQGKLLTGI